MRHRITIGITLLMLWALRASAQTLATPTDFLVSGLDARQAAAASAAQNGFRSYSSGGGVGFGIKGGVLFASFRDATTPLSNTIPPYSNTTGWQAGIFVGGNRTGVLGLMTELTYAKKGTQSSGNVTTDTYYLEVPLLLRVNIGSGNRNKGVIVYAVGGPAADFILKARLSTNDLDVKNQFKDVDWTVLGGAGIEVSRLILEGRFNWGLRNVLQAPGDLKTESFAILGGIRFN